MDADLQELFPEFLEESYDTIEKIIQALEEIASIGFENQDSNAQNFENILRGIHTIKGGCGMFGLISAKESAHHLESELQSYRGKLELLSLEKLNELKLKIIGLEELLNPEVTKTETLKGTEGSRVPTEPSYINSSPHVFPNTSEKAPPDKPQTEGNDNHKPNAAEMLRVPVNLVGDALNGIWEVFLIRNQMSYLFEQQKEYFKNNLEFLQNWEMLDLSLKKNITELESIVMAMRLSSVKNLFARMEKVITNYLADNSIKRIRFTTEGKNIELDKKVIDMLGEPLIHLVRNAMDHGIEPFAERLKLGKPEYGNIKLSAETSTDRVIIKIKDDGKGIDPAKLIAKARAKKLDITDYENGNLNPINIVFLPGFSTADQVTDVSGRGVGMDAVRHSLRQLGGNVSIETEIGAGSTFTIVLPLSLSVITSVVFQVNNQMYGANVNSILEICKATDSSLLKTNGALHYEYRGKFIPCFDLREHISLKTKSANDQSKDKTLFVISYKQDVIAIIVDKVEQNMEVIVKPLPQTVPKMSFVNGMSILPTGRAIFILMLENLVDFMISKNSARRELNAA